MANNHSKNWTLRINFSTTYTVVNVLYYTEMASSAYNYLLSTHKLKNRFKTTLDVALGLYPFIKTFSF